MRKIISKDITHLNKLVEDVLVEFKDYKVFAFFANMGVGKTTFIKELINKFNQDIIVTSPTFSIINEYFTDRGIFYHFDFYRIKNIIEVYDMGIEDYFNSGNYCFIEWAEKIEEILPEETLFVYINKIDDNIREYIFSNKRI